VLHLLYSRFFTKALRDCGYLDIDEPFSGLFTQGMVTHETYQDSEGKWLYPGEVHKETVSETKPGEPTKKKGPHGKTLTGYPPTVGIYKYTKISDSSPVKTGPAIKMSKSKKNTVDPQDILDTYGADAVRLFILSDSPPERDLEWSEAGIEGAWKFINKLYRYIDDTKDLPGKVKGKEPDTFSPKAKELRSRTHSTICGVGEDIENFHLNKAVAKIREFFNHIVAFQAETDDEKWALQEAVESLIRVINPMAPHIAEELWERLGNKTLLVDMYWPEANKSLLASDSVTIGVQVNGKLRASITLPKDADKELAESTAMADPGVQRALEGKEVRKVIVVPNRIVNVVAS
jgi:leucyl-tRNA synthetase